MAAALVCVVGGIASGFVDLIRAGLFGVALLIIAMCLASSRPRRLRVTRTSGVTTMHCGGTYDMTLALEATRGSWLAAEVDDRQTFTSGENPHWTLARIPRSTSLVYAISPTCRGIYRTGPLTVSVSDPLGLMTTVSRHGDRVPWLVWPRIVALQGRGGLRRGEGEWDAVSPQALPSGYSASGIREYAQGDDVRTIHWPATAHRGELMVRQYDPPAYPLTRLVVQGEVDKPGTDESWETLLSLAASTCLHIEELGLPLRAEIHGQHFTDARAAVDAIAAFPHPAPTRPSQGAMHARDRSDHDDTAPTLLFHHASASTTHLPPSKASNLALVSGDSAGQLISDLTGCGWNVQDISSETDLAGMLSAILESFGTSR